MVPETVLLAACKNLRLDSVAMLLEAKADVNGGHFSCALEHAIRAPCADGRADDNIAVILRLIQAGANTHRFHQHSNALACCVDAEEDSNRAITAKALLLNDPSLMARSGGVTPLLLACMARQRDPALFNVLIDAGDDVNACDKAGFSTTACLLMHLQGEEVHLEVRHPPHVTREILHAGRGGRSSLR
jgi:ankyrin repeat protein